MVISIDQGGYLLLPMISGIKDHEKYLFSCASCNCLNPFPEINRFAAQLSERTLVAAFALLLHTYSIMVGVVHPGNKPKQLQTIQAVHKRWRPPPSWRSRRWIFSTAISEFMSFRCRKAHKDPQIRVSQLPLTQTTLTDTIVIVWRSLQLQRSHKHQWINEFIGCRCCTFTPAVEWYLVSQQQWEIMFSPLRHHKLAQRERHLQLGDAGSDKLFCRSVVR